MNTERTALDGLAHLCSLRPDVTELARSPWFPEAGRGEGENTVSFVTGIKFMWKRGINPGVPTAVRLQLTRCVAF